MGAGKGRELRSVTIVLYDCCGNDLLVLMTL